METLQSLVHEMVHQAQAEFPDIYGRPSPRSYHNKWFAKTMISVGLMPSATGKSGGAQTGRSHR